MRKCPPLTFQGPPRYLGQPVHHCLLPKAPHPQDLLFPMPAHGRTVPVQHVRQYCSRLEFGQGQLVQQWRLKVHSDLHLSGRRGIRPCTCCPVPEFWVQALWDRRGDHRPRGSPAPCRTGAATATNPSAAAIPHAAALFPAGCRSAPAEAVRPRHPAGCGQKVHLSDVAPSCFSNAFNSSILCCSMRRALLNWLREVPSLQPSISAISACS